MRASSGRYDRCNRLSVRFFPFSETTPYKAIYGDRDEDFDWDGTRYPLHYYICKLPDDSFLPESLNLSNWDSIFSLLYSLKGFVGGLFDFQRAKRIALRLKKAYPDQDFYSKNEGNGFLSSVDRVTKYMVMASHGWRLEDLLSSSEIGFRCAAYSIGGLSKGEIENGYIRDKAIFFESVADNDIFWKDSEAVAVASNLYYDYTRGTRESTGYDYTRESVRYDYLRFSTFKRKNEERREKEYEEERLAEKEQEAASMKLTKDHFDKSIEQASFESAKRLDAGIANAIISIDSVNRSLLLISVGGLLLLVFSIW